jgi:hypothetical protein
MNAELLAGIVSINVIAWLLCDLIELQKIRRS